MALVIKKLIRGYFYLNYEVSDPRTNPWPLMFTPWTTVLIIISYLYFVLKLGPKLMKNRKPFQLDNILIVYNALQIFACVYLVVKAIALTWNRYSFICQPVDYSQDPTEIEIARLIYFYFWVKVVDLLDTVFFILRKKTSQVSFLHVYHHTGMVGLAWATTKFLAGGHSIYVSTLNSFVHIIMYTYYLLTALDPKYKKSVWWKKHITQLQMLQFLMLIILFTQIAFQDECKYPTYTTIIFVPQNLFMLILFGDFYYKAYIKKKAPVTNTEEQTKDESDETNEDNEIKEKTN